MSKNTKKILIVAVVVILCLAGAFVLTSGQSSAPSSDQQHHENAHKTASEQEKTSDTSTDTPSATNEVKIQDYSYQPGNITVKVGTKVTWTNNDDVRHNVVDDDENPDGPNGPLIAKGESYSFTFTKAGTYNYHCTPHPYMKGTVTVTE